MRTGFSEAELDDLSFDTFDAPDALAEARRLAALADEAPAAAPGRASVLVLAGEVARRGGHAAEALELFERAVADGGEVLPDTRAYLAGALFDVGRSDQAREVMAQLRREKPTDPFVHEMLAEHLEARHDQAGAIAWLTAALLRATGDRTVAEWQVRELATARRRIRRDMGLPPDDLDGYAVSGDLGEPDDYGEEAEEDDWFDDTERQAPPTDLAVLYWPALEFPRLVDRWPHLAEEYGDHAAHRRRLELRLRELSAHGTQRLWISPGTVDEYVGFAEAAGEDPKEGATRSGYAMQVALHGDAQHWPPPRNGPCWCGSGVKYKKCCGAPRAS